MGGVGIKGMGKRRGYGRGIGMESTDVIRILALCNVK
jgi:hypothetical protein